MEMEAVRLPREWPDFTFNNDPRRYLDEVIYLDPEHPLDALLIEQKEAGFPDTLPTPVTQRELIAGVRRGELDTARELVDSHWGLVAAIAYPFKLGPLSPQELLHTGRRGLLEAAKTYDQEQDGEFSDYAARCIHESLSVMIPERAGDSFVEAAELPIEGIYQFIENVQRASTQAKLQKTQAKIEEQEAKWLDEEELKVVSLLHLKAETIKEIGDISSVSKVDNIVASIKEKLGAQTKEEAAVIAWRRGWQYDVVDIPSREHFTVDERLVAMRLYMPFKAIAEELGFTRWKVIRLNGSLRAKTPARTRAELAILAQMHDFEPTEEELNPPETPLVDRLSPMQTKVIQRALYMRDKDIAEMPDIDISEGGIASAISTVIQKAGLEYNTRSALILELYEQGMDFDLAEPTVPLAEAFHAQEIKILQRLHWNYQDIIDDLELDCDIRRLGEIVYDLRQRVGARTRPELALMAKVFYDEDQFPAREVDLETHEWDLVKQIGARALGAKTWEEVLRAADEREQEIITVYFLTPGISSWVEAGTHVGLSASQARKVAFGGIRKAREKLQRRFMSDDELFSCDPNDGSLTARHSQERELVI
jgi:DNA-directed RNA polymerase specialized sigma subunit